MGTCHSWGGEVKVWLTSFHVPLYFVLTGILLTQKNKTNNGRTLWNKLIYPYVTFSCIAILCLFIYCVAVAGVSSGIYQTLINVYKTITGYGIGPIWFIPSYFISCLIFHKISKWPGWAQILLLIACSIIGMMGSYLFEKLSLAGYIYDAIYYPVAAVLRGIACTFFVVLGKMLFVLFINLRERTHNDISVKNFLLAIGIICLILNIWLSRFLLDVNFSILKLGRHPYVFFINGTLGSIWTIVLFYLLKSIYTFPIMQYVGRNSLIIMGTHISLLLTIFVPSLLQLFITIPAYQTREYYLFGAVCVVIMLLLEIPVIYLFNGKLNFLLKGRKYVKEIDEKNNAASSDMGF